MSFQRLICFLFLNKNFPGSTFSLWDVDAFETWLVLSRFFFSGACFFNNAPKNVWLKGLQESMFLFEKANFSSLKF